MLGLYVHIPFCKKICTYCDFEKRLANNPIKMEQYIDLLIKEIETNDYLNHNKIDTIYIGGGTPNTLTKPLMEKLLNSLDKYAKEAYEYSIELNPDLVNDEYIHLLSIHGINRISLGIQSVVDENLKFLGRTHDKNIVTKAINIIKQNGINNINGDFIFGYDLANYDEINENIDFIKKMNFTHVSYYQLILEDKSILKHLLDEDEELIDDNIAYEETLYIMDRLEELGYSQYEISNFAKDGYKSSHNLLYWMQENYVGCGLGATSFIDNVRIKNTTNLDKYLQNINDKYIEKLDDLDLKKEYIILGLRKTYGISLSDYYKKFNTNVLDDFKTLEKYLNKGLLLIEDNQLKFSKNGMMIANIIWEEII